MQATARGRSERPHRSNPHSPHPAVPAQKQTTSRNRRKEQCSGDGSEALGQASPRQRVKKNDVTRTYQRETLHYQMERDRHTYTTAVRVQLSPCFCLFVRTRVWSAERKWDAGASSCAARTGRCTHNLLCGGTKGKQWWPARAQQPSEPCRSSRHSCRLRRVAIPRLMQLAVATRTGGSVQPPRPPSPSPSPPRSQSTPQPSPCSAQCN